LIYQLLLRKERDHVLTIPLAIFSLILSCPDFQAFVSAISSIREPSSLAEALSRPKWKKAMEEEMEALLGTWELVPLQPTGDGLYINWMSRMPS
jgi:hypothetical protein